MPLQGLIGGSSTCKYQSVGTRGSRGTVTSRLYRIQCSSSSVDRRKYLKGLLSIPSDGRGCHLRQVEGRLVTQGAELSTGELSFKQGESSAGLIYDLALLRIQIHEFKSIAVARVAAQDSSNPERAARNGH